jgi:Ribonucleotide reductase alpha domain/LAGLIDADG-like domain
MYVKERFTLDDYTIDLLNDMEPPFGSSFGEFIFYRTYSRCIDGKQENWADCIIRVINGIMSIRKDWYIKNHIYWDQSYWKGFARELAISAFNMHWLPPGRGLFHCGTDFTFERGSMALFNCGMSDIYFKDLADDIGWIMDSLMLGVGVGFGPVREDEFKFKNPKGKYDYIVADSREGWVDSVKAIITAYIYGSSKPRYIYDEIRGPNLPIKGFGGLSTGPGPLKEFHIQLENDIERYMSDSYYDSVLLKADMTNQCGCMVVSGNVRRSAELGYNPIYDETFKNLRNYELYPEREAWSWMSNNSVTLLKNKDFERLGEIADKVIAGEDLGYLNLRNFPYGRIGKKDKVRKDLANGTNPCIPGWSKILTKKGIQELNEVNIGDKIWSEYGWTTIINKWSTGINKVYKYKTTTGIFYGTENHQIVSNCQKIEARYAESIDRLCGPIFKTNIGYVYSPQTVMDGLVLGDGEVKNNVILLNIGDNDHDYFDALNTYLGQTYNKDKTFKVSTTLYKEEIQRTFDREIPERFIKAPFNIICNFLRGLYSANGSVCGNRITLKASSFKIIEDVQLMLSSIGIPSYYTTNKTKIIEFKNGKYQCKESYDLNITKGRKIFQKCIGFIQNYKTAKLNEVIDNIHNSNHKETYEIISTELISEEETFDITVDNPYHTFWNQGLNISNCGEIPLQGGHLNPKDKSTPRVREVCNIDETFPTICKDPKLWYKACEYATFYCSTVSLLPTHQSSTNLIVARNRRIGVGLVDYTGWIDNEGVSKVTKYLRKGYKIVRKANRAYNGEAGIPESIRVTTVKPGGTTPKLPGIKDITDVITSGAGYPNFEHMIRRARNQRNNPIADILKRANVPFEADYYSKNTDVFEFPLHCGPAPPSEEISLWQQAMNLVLLQREWADNAVSNTLNYRPKWKLIKSFSIFEGSIDPEADAKKWIIKNANKVDHEWFLDSLAASINNTNNGKNKLHIRYNEDIDPIEIKLYEYDPKHEEDSIEPVLAAIAPLTKSVSLLPHSPKGAYKQQPEEGISEEEYKLRLSRIKSIDWSTLNNSDGIDEKYCEGDRCLIS